ncbi:hypothetical protein Efla_000156 [Eimeria flavescens]
MWKTGFASPKCRLQTKAPSLGKPHKCPRTTVRGVATYEDLITDWEAKRTPAAAKCHSNASKVMLASGGMSPICSDTSDADEGDAGHWVCASTLPAVPPPPPPPPPPGHPMEFLESGLSGFPRALVPSTCITGQQQQLRQPPGRSVRNSTLAADMLHVEMPPTPPWRKHVRSMSDSFVGLWRGLQHSAPPTSLMEQLHQLEPHPRSTIMPAAELLEDPYSSSSPVDPYAPTRCSSVTTGCLSASVPASRTPQKVNAVAASPGDAAIVVTAANSEQIRGGLPLLLRSQASPEGAIHGPPSQGPSRCAPYIYRPPGEASLPARDLDLRMSSDLQRFRQRARGRQRRDGVFPRRGHEASECHAGQTFRQVPTET